MAEDRQPASVHEGASTTPVANDVEEDIAAKAKSAEDRKAAVALASLDSVGGGSGSDSTKHVDQEAMSKAMKNLKLGASGTAAKKVKVDAADVTLLVDQLEVTKVKATDLLKQHEGDAVKALRAYVAVA
ncbi:hypothetical protein SEUCBS139899_001810 [Sporothrix eucalyptigena]|uniref:Nascent polypeptide-associated complex subunit alpha-like UBA domain-containing protein n=1 Tax=Sporothrix eucalyptigena TaxID=1812306 RepID=A0ABP0CRF1_9PEZI